MAGTTKNMPSDAPAAWQKNSFLYNAGVTAAVVTRRLLDAPDAAASKRGDGGEDDEFTKKAAASGLGEFVLVEDAEELRLLGGAWPRPPPQPKIEPPEVFLESPSPLRRLLLLTELDLERMSVPRSNMAERERPKGDFSFSISAAIVIHGWCDTLHAPFLRNSDSHLNPFESLKEAEEVFFG